MKTKFMYVVVALLLGCQMTISAQDSKDSKAPKHHFDPAKMMAMQASQMARVLMLDDATAAKFTPVYEKYLQELRDARMMNRPPMAKKDGDSKDAKGTFKGGMTDDAVAKMLKDQFAQSRKTLDIREKYYDEFSKVISQKQIMKVYQQERTNMEKFKKEFDRRKWSKFGKGFQPKQSSFQRHGQKTPDQSK